MSILRLSFAAAILAGSICSDAQAATLVGSPNNASAIDGLVVDGVTYDITFYQGSYFDVFGNNPPQITNTTTVDQITLALQEAFTSFGVTGLAGFSLANNVYYDLFIPWQLNGNGTFVGDAVGLTIFNPQIDVNLASDNETFSTTGDFASLGFADIQVAQTPLPAALPLFATGLGAMSLLGWRRKRKNTAAIAA